MSVQHDIHPPYPPQLDQPVRLTPGELLASLEATMKAHRGGPVWLFAYGSLIWRPECPTVETRRARIHGYHRGLYLWSQIHRGTPESPGLVLGLDRGGSCAGFAYRLPDEQLHEHLFALWQREMPDAGYEPRWLNCHLADGQRVQALGFVLRRNLPCYAGALPDHVLTQVFAGACGHYGTTRDYVEKTVNSLRAIPSLAWVPLLLLWLGIDETSKVVLIAIGAFFPVYLNGVAAIRNIDRKLVEVGQMYGFGPARLAWRILLPAALPGLFTGLRSGLSLAWMFLVAAELIAATKGLGYLLTDGRETSRPDLVLASIIVLALLGKLSDGLLAALETRLLAWRDAFAGQGGEG